MISLMVNHLEASSFICCSLLFTKGKNKQTNKSIILLHFSNLKFLFGPITYDIYYSCCFNPQPNDRNISAHILTLLAQHLQAPAKRLKHLNATYRNIVGPTFASSGDTIATFECNISQHCWVQSCARLATLLRRVAPRRDGIENQTSMHVRAQHCCSNLTKRLQHHATSTVVARKL